MNPQRRELPDPTELKNPVPTIMVALIASLVIWGMAYFIWSHLVFEQHNSRPSTYAMTKVNSEDGGASSAIQAKASSQTNEVSDKANLKLAETSKTKSNPPANGKAIFSGKCAACHQGNGKGLAGVFPPLDGSNWVNTSITDIPIQIILHGVNGAMEVNGMTYQGSMPAFKGSLSDSEVAAVVSYIRSSWSNSAGEILASDIKVNRNKRSSPFNGGADINKTFSTSLN